MQDAAAYRESETIIAAMVIGNASFQLHAQETPQRNEGMQSDSNGLAWSLFDTAPRREQFRT
jgi:hypothetical protein